MADFNLSIPTVLRHEGGFVNDSADPGGATNFGVSLRWLKSQGLAGDINHDGDIDISDIRGLTPELASSFYLQCWWVKYGYGNIIPQAVATKIFDTSVNVGPIRAHTFVQQVVGINPTTGTFGPITLGKVNSANSVTLLAGLQNVQAQFYRDLVTKNPARQKFLNGWLNRAFDRT